MAQVRHRPGGIFRTRSCDKSKSGTEVAQVVAFGSDSAAEGSVRASGPVPECDRPPVSVTARP